MSTPDQRIAAMAARQYSLITLAHALAAGLTVRQVEERVRSGRWTRIRPRVYRLVGAPVSYEQAVLAACLSASVPASHLTAARLWGLGLPDPAAIDVISLFDRRVRLEGVQHHRTGLLPPGDVATRSVVPVTRVARTLVDCSALVTPRQLGSVIDRTTRRGLVRLSALHSTFDRIDASRGRGLANMRLVLAKRAPGYEPLDSERELWVLETLERHGLPRPETQFRVRLRGRTYRLDFAYPAPMVALEYDGWDVHGTHAAFHGDRARRRVLTAAGWRIVEVTSETTAHELVRDVRLLLRFEVA